MKLQGSKMVRLECFGCGRKSEPFRLYLYEQDGVISWNSKDLPQGWAIHDKVEFHMTSDTIFALCENNEVI